LVDPQRAAFFDRSIHFKSTVSLSAFTSLDIILQKFGRGALLRAILQKPL
jgi:hypothetical protein